jgi:c-di-GMP-binding flagellar brake protein YcgR
MMPDKNIGRLAKSPNLHIEAGSELTLVVDGFHHPLKSIYVGRKGNRYIVITPPGAFSPAKADLLRGKRIKITYPFKGNIFEFASKLIEIAPNPLKLLVFEFPASITKREFRSQKRISCFIPAKIEKNARIRDGVIKSISKSGCCCVFDVSADANKSLQKGDSITMRFFFPGIVDQQIVSGKIKDIRNSQEQMEVGVEFAEIVWCVPPYDASG